MIRWLAEHVLDGNLLFRIGARGDEELVAEWIGLARLVARRDGTLVELEVEPDADPQRVSKIEAGAAKMLLRQLRGGLTLHASSVAVGENAALLVGASGAGKSTFAAWLVEHAGGLLLSDDLTPVERSGEAWLACPLERNHWVDASAAFAMGWLPPADEGKSPHVASRHADRPSRIAVVVELEFGGESPELIRVGQSDALGFLLRNSVRFAIDDRRRQREDLAHLMALAGSVPFVRLRRPRSFEALRETADLVAGWLLTGIVRTA